MADSGTKEGAHDILVTWQEDDVTGASQFPLESLNSLQQPYRLQG